MKLIAFFFFSAAIPAVLLSSMSFDLVANKIQTFLFLLEEHCKVLPLKERSKEKEGEYLACVSQCQHKGCFSLFEPFEGKCAGEGNCIQHKIKPCEILLKHHAWIRLTFLFNHYGINLFWFTEKKQIKVKLSPKCISVQESLTASIFSVMKLQSCRSAVVVSSLSLYWFPIDSILMRSEFLSLNRMN